MIILGNIFRNGVVDAGDVEFGYGVRLNATGWTFSDGVSKPISGRGIGHSPTSGRYEFSKQLLTFKGPGSFLFRGNDPESVKIINWVDIQQQLIIKLTQTFYSFREIYLVTESATTLDWTLAIANADKAELEIATDAENFGIVDIFGHHSAQTLQSKNIEYYHRESKRKPAFFKAKKLVVRDEKMEAFVNGLINENQAQNEWAQGFYNYDFHYDPAATPNITHNMQESILDMLKAKELNPKTSLLYFTWADANMDDVEKLFLHYAD